jgi:hypothetical protein
MGRLQLEAAELLELPALPVLIAALPPGAISREEEVAKLLSRRTALDERAAAAPTDRQERWQLATEYYQLAVDLRNLEQLPDSEALPGGRWRSFARWRMRTRRNSSLTTTSPGPRTCSPMCT